MTGTSSSGAGPVARDIAPEVVDDPELVHASALAGLPKMGPNRLGELLAHGDPVDVWQRLLSPSPSFPESRALPSSAIDDLARHARSVDPWAVWASVRELGVVVSRPIDPDYPGKLLLDQRPPPLVYRLGCPVPSHEPTVAVVGTRRCTRYGHDMARALARTLAEAGVGVVSGLALGIDAAAHHGSLAAEVTSDAVTGSPTGVVAGGVDTVYPRRNRDLWWQVRAAGRLISEMPPGCRPDPWRFLARNRVIAALADVVVVVESHERGGALHTADFALEAGRAVHAVPGPITSSSSRGTNQLIDDGARPLLDIDRFVADVVCQFAPASSPPVGSPGRRRPGPADSPDDRGALPPDAALILDVMGESPHSFEALVEASGLDLQAVSAALDALVATGRADVRSGWYERVHS